jgi:hypothetical protein
MYTGKVKFVYLSYAHWKFTPVRYDMMQETNILNDKMYLKNIQNIDSPSPPQESKN